jgi:hypothetical protein
VPSRRATVAVLAAAALGLPIAACGDESVDDLRQELREAEEAAKGGSEDAKREVRELEREIERELNDGN